MGGDGTAPQQVENVNYESISYQYAEPGTYKVQITGECNSFQMQQIKKVIQWGDLNLSYWNSSFTGCTPLESIPRALPKAYDTQ